MNPTPIRYQPNSGRYNPALAPGDIVSDGTDSFRVTRRNGFFLNLDKLTPGGPKVAASRSLDPTSPEFSGDTFLKSMAGDLEVLRDVAPGTWVDLGGTQHERMEPQMVIVLPKLPSTVAEAVRHLWREPVMVWYADGNMGLVEGSIYVRCVGSLRFEFDRA